MHSSAVCMQAYKPYIDISPSSYIVTSARPDHRSRLHTSLSTSAIMDDHPCTPTSFSAERYLQCSLCSRFTLYRGNTWSNTCSHCSHDPRVSGSVDEPPCKGCLCFSFTLNITCWCCGAVNHLEDGRCKQCGYVFDSTCVLSWACRVYGRDPHMSGWERVSFTTVMVDEPAVSGKVKRAFHEDVRKFRER